MHNQRRTYKNGKLAQDLAAQLEGIEFNWGTQKKGKDKSWGERFNELAVYKEKNGDCKVPQSQRALGNWVHNQRRTYKNRKLAQERATQLEGIRFN